MKKQLKELKTNMIIDVILDRKDGANIIERGGKLFTSPTYKPGRFYQQVASYGEIAFPITEALDGGEEADVKQALRDYIKENDYNLELLQYIDSVEWL